MLWNVLSGLKAGFLLRFMMSSDGVGCVSSFPEGASTTEVSSSCPEPRFRSSETVGNVGQETALAERVVKLDRTWRSSPLKTFGFLPVGIPVCPFDSCTTKKSLKRPVEQKNHACKSMASHIIAKEKREFARGSPRPVLLTEIASILSVPTDVQLWGERSFARCNSSPLHMCWNRTVSVVNCSLWTEISPFSTWNERTRMHFPCSLWSATIAFFSCFLKRVELDSNGYEIVRII